MEWIKKNKMLAIFVGIVIVMFIADKAFGDEKGEMQDGSLFAHINNMSYTGTDTILFGNNPDSTGWALIDNGDGTVTQQKHSWDANDESVWTDNNTVPYSQMVEANNNWIDAYNCKVNCEQYE